MYRVSRCVEEELVREYRLMGEFLLELRKEFGENNEELVKVVKLRSIEQEGKIMEEFV